MAHLWPGQVARATDAELIRLCDRLTANRMAWLTLFASRHSVEDERRTEPENERQSYERDTLLDQIDAAPQLSTMAAAVAMARAAIADAPLGLDNHWEARSQHEWLALMVAEFLAGEPFQNNTMQLAVAANGDHSGEDVA